MADSAMQPIANRVVRLEVIPMRGGWEMSCACTTVASRTQRDRTRTLAARAGCRAGMTSGLNLLQLMSVLHRPSNYDDGFIQKEESRKVKLICRAAGEFKRRALESLPKEKRTAARHR
jgi:hypothetical protein